MKIGILNFVGDSTVDPASLAKICEALGFESLFLAEHPVVPTHYTRADGSQRVPDGKPPEILCRISDPFVSLSFAAAVTTRIKLGTGICLVPERSPLLTAKEVATLDLYSGGSVIFGIGAGWNAEESAVMGVEFRRRWVMTREYIKAMKELWTKDESTFEGKFVKFPPVYCYPKPIQKPHPPVLIGAGGMQGGAFKPQRALRDTVTIGDGWAPIGLTPGQLARGRCHLENPVRRSRTRLRQDGRHPVLPGGLEERPSHHRAVPRRRRDPPGIFPTGAGSG